MPRGRVRIIAGRWRRRLLPVLDAPGLRPTPDRVRETLFNWLADEMPGSRCLDLFAGTGALGLEAASRGAERVVLIERDARLARHLTEQVHALGAQDVVEVHCADGPGWCRSAGERFDVVFVDPPYARYDLVELLDALHRSGALAPHARVFVECARDAPARVLPAGWTMLREQRAGRVRYHLAAPPDQPAASSPS